MAYEVGSLSSLISGIKENTNEKIIFRKKVTKRESPSVDKKVRNKRETSEYKRTELKESEQLVSRSKVPRAESASEEKCGPLNTDGTRHISLISNIDLESAAGNSNAVNALKRIQSKQNAGMSFRDREQESRTIFVKNLPHTLDKRKIKKILKKFGEIEAIRLRCAAVEDMKISKKFAVIKSKFHAERSTISAFIRFIHKEDALSALAANGTVVENHHIFVDEALNSNKHDQKRCVFLGNIPFSVEEEEIWTIFENCGKILDIRIIRDMKTGIGKGFAYVTFESADAVELALNLNEAPLRDRPLRVSRVVRKKKIGFNRHSDKRKWHTEQQNGQNAHYKKNFKIKSAKQKGERPNESNVPNRKFSESSSQKTMKQKQKQLPFQGQKSLDWKQKRKQKINKMEQKKKIIALKLKYTAKPAKEKKKGTKHSV